MIAEFDKKQGIDFQQLWSDLKESVTGSERDFTATSLGKAIFLLSVPMVLEMIMESIFAVADIYFVSQISSEAIAVVGITESAMTIVYAIGMGLSVATTALISRRIGEKHREKAEIIAFQAIIAGTIISLLLAIPGVLLAEDFLRLMGASDQMATEGAVYPAIMFGGNIVVTLLFIINAIFRSSGDAAISMRVLWIGNLINMVMDPLLIFGIGPFPEMGLKGAAIATNIGRGIAVAYQFYILFGQKHRIGLTAKSIVFIPQKMIQLLRLSVGGIFQNMVATSSWLVLVRFIAMYGADAVAGYTIAIRIVVFSLLPSWGLSNAASTLVGQHLGARHPQKAERAVWITGYINMGLLGLIGLVLILYPQSFIHLFITEETVVNYGIDCLRIISYGFVSYGLGMVLIQGFNGSGDTTTPMYIYMFCYWLLEIPLAWFLSTGTNLGLSGVFISIFIAETTLTVVALALFLRGRWKKIRI